MKWQNYAAPDDPDSYNDVDGVWPTDRGTYETAEFLTGSTYTATGTGEVVSAWFFPSSSTSSLVAQHYVVENNGKIWQLVFGTPTSLVDRTGTATFGNSNRAQMVAYGNVTIMVVGSTRTGGQITGGPTSATSGLTQNFSPLAGAPQGESICVASNAVIITCTDTAIDGWHASDVGDYTNWTTGESASGRVYFPAGPIFANVSYRGAAYLFKNNSMHRLRYVGGTVKWAKEDLWEGYGCNTYNAACAGQDGILFAGPSSSDTGSPTTPYYFYDGVNEPVCVNPFTEVTGDTIVYHPEKNIFSVWNGNTVYYFNPDTQMWGKNTAPFGSSPPTCKPIQGGSVGIGPTTRAWGKSADNTLKNFTSKSHAGSGYVETSKMGDPVKKGFVTRATPLLRRRVDSGTQSDSLVATFFNRRHDTSSSFTRTFSADSDRFTFTETAADNYARFKYSFTDYDIEIDGIDVNGSLSGNK